MLPCVSQAQGPVTAAAPSCSPAGSWMSPESSWWCCRVGTQSHRGNARALHPSHSMDNNVQAQSLFGKAPGSRWAPRLLSLRHTCEALLSPDSGGQKIPESQIPLCSAWIPFVHALPRIHWYFCKDFIPDGRCQPVSFACERSRGAVVRFWCSLHVLSVLVPTSPVSAVFSSTPSLIGFH